MIFLTYMQVSIKQSLVFSVYPWDNSEFSLSIIYIELHGTKSTKYLDSKTG